MQSCIDDCLACYRSCLSMATGHCLRMGGKHAEEQHLTHMHACAEICRTASHLMVIGSKHAPSVCAVCAEICEECAKECERVGDMDDCVAACRQSAESCRKMAA
ncbi:four-helix bundle copper-binding protein [Fulvimarina pelagi]